MSLPKKNRVRRTIKDKKIGGKKFFSSSFLSLKTQKIEARDSKFTVIVPAKIIKSAVKRNLLKRRIKEIIRKLLSTHSRSAEGRKKIKEPIQGIFYTKKGISDLSFKELKKEVENLLKKI